MQGLFSDLIERLKERGWTLTTAESCTGGMMAVAITDVPGSSAVFDRSFITYSNHAKTELLGVSEKTLHDFGAVSEQTAKEMAHGAASAAKTHIAVSITGVAGPDGGTDEKPVGLVYIGICERMGEPKAYKHFFKGDRNSIRRQSVEAAAHHVMEQVA